MEIKCSLERESRIHMSLNLQHKSSESILLYNGQEIIDIWEVFISLCARGKGSHLSSLNTQVKEAGFSDASKKPLKV